MSLSFLTSFYFVLAIYMVAFFVNRKSLAYLLACITSEVVGRASFFHWAFDYEYGVFIHMFWAIIYCYCLMLYCMSIVNFKLTAALTLVLVFYQLIMAWDCKWSEGNATFLYDSYKYIIIFIHCCIVSSLIERRNIVSRMDESASRFWRVFSLNGHFLFFGYNNKNIKNNTGSKK